MFGNVWRWAGQRRQIELNIGAPHYHIDAQLQTLLDDLHYWHDHSAMPPAEQAAHLHHRAVYVHPFLNGNGRWARLLANIWLRRLGHPITFWPDDTIGQTSSIRTEYIAAIKAADNGDYQPLFALHEKFKST
jgi:Fic-DOC domain mobile mystery protein B